VGVRRRNKSKKKGRKMHLQAERGKLTNQGKKDGGEGYSQGRGEEKLGEIRKKSSGGGLRSKGS